MRNLGPARGRVWVEAEGGIKMRLARGAVRNQVKLIIINFDYRM